MSRCERWELVQCPRVAVERLIYCNPRCVGQGYLFVCEQHLREHLTEHLLVVIRSVTQPEREETRMADGADTPGVEIPPEPLAHARTLMRQADRNLSGQTEGADRLINAACAEALIAIAERLAPQGAEAQAEIGRLQRLINDLGFDFVEGEPLGGEAPLLGWPLHLHNAKAAAKAREGRLERMLSEAQQNASARIEEMAHGSISSLIRLRLIPEDQHAAYDMLDWSTAHTTLANASQGWAGILISMRVK